MAGIKWHYSLTDKALNEEMKQDVDSSGLIGQMADMVQMTIHTWLVGII